MSENKFLYHLNVTTREREIERREKKERERELININPVTKMRS